MIIFGNLLKWPPHHFIFDLFQIILMASFLLDQRKQGRKKFMPDGRDRKDRIVEVKNDCFLFHNWNGLFNVIRTDANYSHHLELYSPLVISMSTPGSVRN